MKLAAIYNVFDGEELLIGSINQIYKHVDELIIVYQTRSNYGREHDNSLVLNYIDSHYDCILHKYIPDYRVGSIGASNETMKRAIGLDLAKFRECTHFMFIDCDEYYDTKEFAEAKKEVEDNKYDATACRLYTYYKEPTYQLDPPEKYFVPFICEVKEVQTVGGRFEVLCDPTRGVTPVERFKTLDIKMHHFSYIRNDIRLKLENSSASGNFISVDDLCNRFDTFLLGEKMINFDNYDIKEVENIFSI